MKLIVFILSLLVLGLKAQIIPFVNCTINQGGNCITMWGYTNNYPNTIVLPLFQNRFSPAPIFRGQPTVFSASTTVFEAFNTTRSCSSGNLTWSLTDPNTNIVHSATVNNITGDTCSVQSPVNINCVNNTKATIRLQQCQTQCGSQCSYCGQVFSYCNQVGLITANFTLDSCIITNLGFNLVSSGCNYQQVLNNCCQNVGPPISPPVTPPVTPPISPPVTVPVSPPIPPPITPNETAVCSFGFYQNAYNCMSNTSLGNNCTDRTATCQGLLLTIGNNTQTDDCILFNIGGSNNESGNCNFVSWIDTCCGTLPAGNITCTAQADCPVNYVCTANPGTCSGIQGATCGMNQLCSNLYNCSSGICTNGAFDSFQSAIVNQCASAPTLQCNTTASIALQESITLPTGLSCNNPSTAFLAGSAVGYFYMPTTNSSFDSFNNTFTIFNQSPRSLSIRVILPCGANFCDRCLQNIPVPPSPPLSPPIPPQPPAPCKDDTQCKCNFCCETGDCVQCPIRCSVNPCPQGYYCTSLKYCTTNRICEGLEIT